MSENTGRSYRLSSSRYAASLPALASATTSWSVSDWRSFPEGIRRIIYAPHARAPQALMPAAPVLPATPPEKQRYVRAMFSDIAPRYDLLNGVLSFRLARA